MADEEMELEADEEAEEFGNYNDELDEDIKKALEETSQEEPEIKEPPKEEETAEAETTEEAKETEPDEPEPDNYEPPNRWTKAQKDWFKSLPKMGQAALYKGNLDVERYFTKRSEELAQKERTIDEIKSAVEPFAAEWELKGINVQTGIRQLARAQQFLDNDPVAGIKAIAASYGLDLADLVDSDEDTGEGYTNGYAQEQDPARQALENRLNSIESLIQGNYQQQVHNEVASFAYEKDANGKFLRPEMADISFMQNELTPQVQILKAQNPAMPLNEVLGKAYDNAIWLNPERRQARIQREQVEKLNSQQSQQIQRANKAKAGAVSISGSPRGRIVESEDVPDSIEDTIQMAMKSLGMDF